MDQRPVAVLGAGQVGLAVARALAAQGERVRLVRRGAVPEGPWTAAQGDLTDPTFARTAVEGARAVVHCAVPPYHQWRQALLPLTRSVLEAAKRAQAPVLVLDNLYAYGRPTGPLREDSPLQPCSVKGALRAEAAQAFLDADREGSVRAAVARASDFYGPGVTLSGVFGQRFVDRLRAGKPLETFGDADALHSYSYAPDVAAGLVTLVRSAQAWGQVWHLPVAPAESTRRVLERFAQAAGRPLRTSRVPALALKLMGLFVPPAGELVEMLYQWEAPFVLEDAKFRAAFGQAATPLSEGVARTAAWALGAGSVSAAVPQPQA